MFECDEAQESKLQREMASLKVDVVARLDFMVCESLRSVRDFVGQVQLLSSTHADTKTVFIICVVLLFHCSVFFSVRDRCVWSSTVIGNRSNTKRSQACLR